MTRARIVAAVVVATAVAAALDFRTCAELDGSILYTIPLALCALQRSKRLLWGTASAAVLLTVAAEFWGFDREPLRNLAVVSVNRLLLIASLLTLTTIIHFWIQRARRIERDAAEIGQQRNALVAQNEQLDLLVAAGSSELGVRKEAERHLAQMEGRYRGLLEAAPDAMVVVNPAGEIVLLNVQAEKRFGYHRDELVGQQVKNIIPQGFAERLVADGLRSVEDALAQQIGTGIELIGRRKDGSDFPIEIMLSPLQNSEGVLVTAAIRDISVRKAAEEHLARLESKRRLVDEALRQSEEQSRMVLDGIQNYAIFMMDPGGKIVSWNAGAERIKGYPAAEIIGRNFACFFPPEDLERGRPEEVLRLATSRGRYEEQGMRLRKDGSRFLASITLTALRDQSGSLRGFSEFSHDLSEIKESEARYRGLLEAAPDAMVVVNQGGEIVLLNVQAEKQFGYRRDELVGQQVKNIIPQGFAERLLADGLRSVDDALAQQIGTGIELVGRRKDASAFPIEIMLSPLQGAEGILVTAAIRNISVRKAADENQARTTRELTLKHQLLDAVVEGTTDPVYVRDLEGRFILANSAVARVFGLSVKEVLGKSLRELLPNESADVVFQSDQEIVRTGVTSTVEDVAEIDGITRLFVTTKGPYRDADQTIIGTIGIAREITEQRKQEEARVEELIRDISVRKAAEKHLAQMEGRYRGLLEAAPDAMVVVNHDGEIVLLNVQAEKQFGYRRDELVGQRVKNIIPQGFAERLVADGLRSVEDALAQQIGTGIELIGRRKDGSDFPIEIMLSPLESADGILVTAAVRDISVRKAAEARLRQKMEELNRSNEELEQFAYIASHDLQEPLRMVASYTQLLSRRYKGKLDADADEFIAFAVDGASRMQRLIQDLLTYSRVATKGRDLLQTSSQEALQHALTNLRGAIEKSGALVTHDSLPTVLADQTQLVQLFQNLVGNAIKYQNPGVPRVHVSAARNGGEKWVFAVKDNGLGIEPQYFDKIFGMFQRLHRRDQFEGTGIGLAICKKIVERHGGHILLESQLGHGSTFRFALAGSEGQS